MSSTDPPSPPNPPPAPPPGAKTAPSKGAAPRRPKPKTSKLPPGRQRTGSPAIPWEEIERQYIYGVPRETEGGIPFVHYPTQAELAAAFGVSTTAINGRVIARQLDDKRAAFQAETEATIRKKLRTERGNDFVARFSRIGDTTDLLEQAVAIAVRAFLVPAKGERKGNSGAPGEGDVEVAPPLISSLDAKGYASALKQIAETQKVCAGVLSTMDPDAPPKSDADDEDEPEMDEEAARAYLRAKMNRNQAPDDGPGGAD